MATKVTEIQKMYGRRVRNVDVDGLQFNLTVVPRSGPKPKRYAYLCCGAANWDCIRCRMGRPI